MKGKHKLAQQLAAEPKASRGLPPCPDYLVGRARDAWTFWSHELELVDLDRRPDGPMLEGVCIAYDAAISRYETIKNAGPVHREEDFEPGHRQAGRGGCEATPRRAAGEPGAGSDERDCRR